MPDAERLGPVPLREAFRQLDPLEESRSPPKDIYLGGRRELLKRSPLVAVIGSREASSDGLIRAGRISSSLAKHGIVVVSGLASGIDSAAHVAAIESGGDTIAVLGTSLDIAYPKENYTLQSKIGTDHLLVSQFRWMSPISRSNFPIRNALMALISDMTIVVEAKDGSGTLSQVRESMRLGRAVFIMKSMANSKTESWPAKAIEAGAKVLSAPKDVLDMIGPT